MKKILIVTDNLPEQINGVVTTYKNIEACAILDGYNVVYLNPRWFCYFDCPRYNELKISIPWKIGEAIEEISADHIHIATEGPIGLCARQYLDKRGIRYNTAYHTKLPEGINKLFGIPENIVWPLVRWFHKHSGKVLTTTETMVKDLKQHDFDGEIIPWTRGVDRNIFNPWQRQNNNNKNMVCVSRVSKEKNLEDFFKLDYAGYQKIMVGDGPMLETYKKTYPDVMFVGYKTGHDLAKYYANADVFVFPSKWETFGLVMIESMACGTPVAAFDCDGPRDVIDTGITGYYENNLNDAIQKALKIDRNNVYEGSFRWSWDNAWKIFKQNLI